VRVPVLPRGVPSSCVVPTLFISRSSAPNEAKLPVGHKVIIDPKEEATYSPFDPLPELLSPPPPNLFDHRSLLSVSCLSGNFALQTYQLSPPRPSYTPPRFWCLTPTFLVLFPRKFLMSFDFFYRVVAPGGLCLVRSPPPFTIPASSSRATPPFQYIPQAVTHIQRNYVPPHTPSPPSSVP